MRDLGFKPEGERMAVYQSRGETQNRREHGRKGIRLAGPCLAKKRMMKYPEAAGNKRQGLTANLGQEI